MDFDSHFQYSHNLDLENGDAPRRNRQQTPFDSNAKQVTWQQWIDTRFDWSWFAMTQSTGGIAVLLSECPKQFDGLQTIGKTVYIFNIVLYIVFISLLVARWTINPKKMQSYFIDPPECFFYGSIWLSAASIIVGMQRFGAPNTGPWMIMAIRICFWIYAGVTLLSATIHMVVTFQFTPITVIGMSPTWFIVLINTMYTGTIASSIAMSQPPEERLSIIVAGVAYQGLGWIGSMVFFAWYFGYLFEKGWPPHEQRPGLFLADGAGGYTIVSLIGVARACPEGYAYFATHPIGREILMVVATFVGIFVWFFTFWVFGMAVCICVVGIVSKIEGQSQRPTIFRNTFWGMLYPDIMGNCRVNC